MSFEESVQNPEVPPLRILREAVARFGVECLPWSREAFKMTIERELHVEVNSSALNRLLATCAMALQDNFWMDWEHFHFLTQAVNGILPNFVQHQELSIGQMMLAVSCADRIREELGPLHYEVPYSEEVARYVAAQALDSGVWWLPAPLDFATRYAAGLRYKCRDCGNNEEVTFDDGLCDVCTARFRTDKLSGFKPDPDALKAGKGRNIVYFEKNPTGPVKRRYEELLAHPNYVLQPSPVDNCVSRLLAARVYTAKYME